MKNTLSLRTRLLALGILAVTVAAAREPGMTSFAATPASADKLTLFAFDNYSIPYQRNLYLTMHPPDEYPGNPVVRHGEAGTPDESSAQFYGSILQIGGKYRMWYLGLNPPSKAFQMGRPGHPPSFRLIGVCYAESEDGIHWAKPDLGLVEFNGSKKNNLVELAPSQPGTGNVFVLYEPQDPDPSHRYKMMLLVFPNIKKVINTILPFFSADGLHWRQAVPGSFNENGNLEPTAAVIPLDHFEIGGLYRFQNTYYATGQQISPYTWLADGSQSGRIMSVFRSHDFTHWSDTKSQGFIRWGYRGSAPGQGEEVHMPAASWNRDNVLVGLYGQFHGRPGSKLHPLDLGFLISNDGVHFREPMNNYVFMAHDPGRHWQCGGLVQGQGFFNVGDETFVYFSGWDGDVSSFETRAEIGLARLRRDGFGSFSPMRPGLPASFITCALQAHTPARLWLNATGLSSRARLKVELLDAEENPLDGYADLDAATLEKSGTQIPVSWPKGDIVGATGRAFKVRVAFEGESSSEIRVYALYAGR